MSNPFLGNIAYGGTLPYTFYVPALEPFGLQNIDDVQYQILKKNSSFSPIVGADRVNIGPASPAHVVDWLNFGSLTFSSASSTSSGFISRSISAQRVKQLVDYLTYTKLDERTNAANNKLIKEIMNSKTKYASGTTMKGRAAGTTAWPVHLYFYDKSTKQAGRPPGLKSSQSFCGVPRRASGSKYSAVYSREEQASLDDTGNLKIGTFIDTELIGDQDIIHHASGPLKMSWNEDLGMWDASAHFLASLLTDVRAADITLSSLSSSNTFDRKAREFYNNDLNEFSNFTTGLAAPLQTHNNNPYSFGPNLVKCADAQRVEQIRVVNRSNNSFKAGEIVMVFQIGAENIIMPFSQGDTPEALPASIGRWGFAKFIATSDEYFRTANVGNKLMLPEMISEIIRYRSYYHERLQYPNEDDDDKVLNCPKTADILDATRLNHNEIFSVNFSKPPQSCITDQDGTLNSPKKFDRINIYRGADADANVGNLTYLNDVPLFWGPMFPDGYGGGGFQQPAETVSATPFSDMLLNQVSGGFPVPDWNDILDSLNNTSSSLPASIPIAKSIASNISNKAGLGNYNWNDLEVSFDDYTPPNNPNRVQFSLLSCELVGADDSKGDSIREQPNVPEQYRKFPTAAKDIYRNFVSDGTALAAGTKFWPRFANNTHVHNSYHPDNNATLYTNTDNATGGPKFDEYVTLQPLNKPKGAVTLFGGDSLASAHGAYMGSNTVGIIAARNRLSGGGGGGLTINASVDQMFGMKGRFVHGGGLNNTVNLTVIPLLGGVIFGSKNNLVEPKSFDIPTWGSNIGDSIDSFGTAALYGKVYDAWDDCDTLWIPQHFTVLHFNPTLREDQEDSYISEEIDYRTATWAEKTPLDENDEPLTTGVTKYLTITPFDYKVPTHRNYLTLTDPNDADNTVELPLYGTEYVKNVGDMFSGKTVEESFWHVDTQCRRQYVSNHGYSYKRLAFGIPTGINWSFSGATTIKNGGENFERDETYTLDGDIRIKITGVGGNGDITSFKIEEGTFIDSRGNTHKFRYRGSGLHDSFPMTIYLPSRTGGEPAEIYFPEGQVWESFHKTYGPKLQVPSTRLTLSSGTGQHRKEGVTEAALNIGENLGSIYKGQYEAFFHCFNDIQFVWHNEPEYTTGLALAQYITLTMA